MDESFKKYCSFSISLKQSGLQLIPEVEYGKWVSLLQNMFFITCQDANSQWRSWSESDARAHGGCLGGLAPPRKILPFAVAGGVILMQSLLQINFFFYY